MSTLAWLLAPAVDLGRARDWRRLVNPGGCPVALMCRCTVSATGRAVGEVAAAAAAGVGVGVLVVVVDGWPVPGAARARLRLLAGRVGRVVRVPYVPGWRYVERPDPACLPRAVVLALAAVRLRAGRRPAGMLSDSPALRGAVWALPRAAGRPDYQPTHASPVAQPADTEAAVRDAVHNSRQFQALLSADACVALERDWLRRGGGDRPGLVAYIQDEGRRLQRQVHQDLRPPPWTPPPPGAAATTTCAYCAPSTPHPPAAPTRSCWLAGPTGSSAAASPPSQPTPPGRHGQTPPR